MASPTKTSLAEQLARVATAAEELPQIASSDNVVKKFAPPHHPDRISLEQGMRETIQQQVKSVGVNSHDMDKLQQVISNSVTAAHDDTGRALDRVREEARALMTRIDHAVDEHKQMLNEEGQKIAILLEAAMQELTRTVGWMEEQSPRLRTPKLEAPALPKPDEKQDA